MITEITKEDFNMSILEISGVKKIYTTRFGDNKTEALRSVSFDVKKGEYVAIMGESGSGKTTLLNILAAIDKPTSSSVILDGNDFSKTKNLRRQHSDVIILDLYFRNLICLIRLP